MSKVKLTRYIIQSLRDENASHIFLVPGGYVDNFSQDLVDVEGIKPIVCATEGGAAMMADGFARASGRFGVCMGISGPGATNMITALSVSSADQIPVLAITGDTPLSWRDRAAIQDSGTHGLRSIELFRQVCASQYQVYEPRLIRDYTRRMMPTLKGPHHGVAHLSVPLDLQSADIEYDYQATCSKTPLGGNPIDPHALTDALDMISRQPRTALLIGSGIRKSNATSALIDFAERFEIPVATTMAAKGDFPETHPLSMGVFGWAGSGLANETLLTDEIDCLVVVGSTLGQISTMCWSEALRKNRQFIQIDINGSHLNRTYVADLAITSDARVAFEYMCAQDNDAPPIKRILDTKLARRDWLLGLKDKRPWFYDTDNQTSSVMPMHPARAVTTLADVMPQDTQLFVDNGAHTFFATHYWKTALPRHYFNIIKYSGAMGWAIAASIGAKVARPEKTTVAIVGDGCMLMHGMEIQTAARYKLKNMIFVVLNNKAHGNPKLRTEGFSDEAEELTDIVDHNWAAFAESLGVKGLTVESPDDLSRVYQSALDADSTVLIDVKCGLYATPTKVFDETFMKEFNSFLSN